MRQGSVVYYLHGDHLGSTSLTTNQSGGLVSQARYLPYGETRWGSSGPTDFGFTGQRSDGFGLYDYNARYYSQVLGRFISPDTVVPEPLNSQEWNRYSYVTNNPLRFKDPTGHKQESGAGVGGNREVYLILAHQYEEAAAAAGDSWRGTLNEYNFALAGKYYSLAEGNLITAQTQDAIIEGPLYTRLATSGYFGAEEQVNAAAEAAGGDLAEASLNSLGGVGAAGAAAAAVGGGGGTTCLNCGTNRPNLARGGGSLRIDPDGASVYCETCLKNGQTTARSGNKYWIKSFDDYETEAQATGLGTPYYSPEPPGGPGHFSVFQGGPTDKELGLWQRLNKFIRDDPIETFPLK